MSAQAAEHLKGTGAIEKVNCSLPSRRSRRASGSTPRIQRLSVGSSAGQGRPVVPGDQSLERALDVKPDFFPALKNLAVLHQNAGWK